MSSPDNPKEPNRKVVLGVCIFLAVITWLVFGQTLGHNFINFDDPDYVFNNAEVKKGLTLHGIAWAFHHSVSRNWHPLTIATHMLDCEVYGLRPGGHHLTNVVLHTVAAILLFLVLEKMTAAASWSPQESVSLGRPERTGNIWRCAFVAAVFAFHPLRVESVAWISERKDVLSGVFFMLTLAAYLRYARKPSVATYLLVLVTFALGLMSKPMLVTLPFVLLLLDYWPLGRLTATPSTRSDVNSPSWQDRRSIALKLICEKIPFLLFAGIASFITLALQGEKLSSLAALPVWTRLCNAAVSSVLYIWQMFWPVKLAIFYPFPPGGISGWMVVLASVVLSAGTYIAWILRKQRPYVFTGWFWYLGMLLPVVGLIQVGGQTRADRYTYLPQIGLYLAATWAVADLSASWRNRRQILSVLTAIVIGLLTWRAWVQTSYWKNDRTIWARTLAVTSNNAVAHLSLGHVLLETGQADDAISHFQESLKISSQSRVYGVSTALANNGLGDALLAKGLVTDAIAHYRTALQIKPDYAAAENDLALALFRNNSVDEAILHYQKALSLDPNMPNAYAGMGDALLQQHLTGEAIAFYEKSLQLAPASAPTLSALAWVLATSSDAKFRNGPRAIQLAGQAIQLTQGKNPRFIRTLAAAHAQAGQFDQAIQISQEALKLAATTDPALANQLQMDIDLYRMNFTLH